MDENKRKEMGKWAQNILNNKDLYEKSFEDTFTKYDINKDGTINLEEYSSFLEDIFKAAGCPEGTGNLFAPEMFYFKDLNKNGKLEKEEFKREFKSALHRIVQANS